MPTKIVVLKLDGSLSKGVAATLTIGPDGLPPAIEISGTLPPAITVSEAYEKWRFFYWRWSKFVSRIIPGKITYEGTLAKLRLDCDKSSVSLRSSLNIWLKTSEDFSSIRDTWLRGLKPDDSVRVLIRTSSKSLQKLPWHLWDLIEECPNVEVALSSIDFESPVSAQTLNSQEQVRILAILGDSTGIDVEADRQVIENLPGGKTTFLVEPTIQKVDDALWEKAWDVLFFAGHSRSEKGTGRIYINNTDSLTITELSNALRKAVNNGLQLAIFNSCDGLDLAQELQRLGLSQVIVMREPVPDVVAQDFLKYFLVAFSSDQPLYTSVREARDRLKRLERTYPCATWLPTIYQNPGKLPPTWQQLRGKTSTAPIIVKENRQMGRMPPTDSGGQQQNRQHSFGTFNLKTVLILSALVWVAVMGARYLGMLQTWELESFDHLQRLRPLISPEEGPDSRILIVGITEEDLHLSEQSGRKGSLSDYALDLLLQRLKRAKARVIGLDIYHDFPVSKNQRRLANFMRTNNNFFAVCKASDAKLNNPGISPPAIPVKRQGLSDIKLDSGDVLRRYLLSITTPIGSPCAPHYALSFQIGFHYLSQEESQTMLPNYNKTKNREMQIGDFVLQRLRSHTGAYQNLNAWGYQSLINYRAFDGSPINIAPQVSLKQMLSDNRENNINSIKDSDIEGRIVLIGTTTANPQDYLFTPYSDGEISQKIPGVVAQAQMVSQIISAAKDGRPLLWFWPWWGEGLFVFCCSLGGAVLVWKVRSPLLAGAAIIVFGAGLYLTSLELYVYDGSWAPLVPSALALAGGSTSVALLASFTNHRQRN